MLRLPSHEARYQGPSTQQGKANNPLLSTGALTCAMADIAMAHLPFEARAQVPRQVDVRRYSEGEARPQIEVEAAVMPVGLAVAEVQRPDGRIKAEEQGARPDRIIQ